MQLQAKIPGWIGQSILRMLGSDPPSKKEPCNVCFLSINNFIRKLSDRNLGEPLVWSARLFSYRIHYWYVPIHDEKRVCLGVEEGTS
jgi:hypothetical protein